MRIRIALSLGALVLAGGALTGGIAMASQPAPTAPPAPTATTKPAPTATTKPAPGTLTPVPTASKAPQAARPEVAPRVPKAVPAGPTGDLHLPAIVEGR